jgi:signal transduction histidine kinase
MDERSGRSRRIDRLLKDNLEKVVQHGKRADSIVKNMLLHSREGSGEHRPADINSLLDESLNLAYHGARAEKASSISPAARLRCGRRHNRTVSAGDHPRILNLISNGVYAATKRKTEIKNLVLSRPSGPPRRTSEDTVEIRIRDNGTGIPAEVKEKMFNPVLHDQASR